MSKSRRKFSVEQKLQIIQETDQNGITQTLRKHSLSHSVFLRWKHQFNSGGVTSLKPQYYKSDPEVRALHPQKKRRAHYDQSRRTVQVRRPKSFEFRRQIIRLNR